MQGVPQCLLLGTFSLFFASINYTIAPYVENLECIYDNQIPQKSGAPAIMVRKFVLFDRTTLKTRTCIESCSVRKID